MEGMEQKQTNKLRRLAVWIITVLLAAGALYLVVNRDVVNLDSLARWYRYQVLERNSAGENASFSHGAQSSDCFLTLKSDLLVCSHSMIRLYSTAGVNYLEESVSLTNPVASVSGSKAVVYDAGGQELRVIGDRKVLFSLTLTEDQSLISANLNENGRLAVTSKQEGYKGVVTIYDTDFKPVMSLRLSSRFLSDAAVAPDGKSFCAVSPGQSDGLFANTLLFYSVSGGQDPTAQVSLGSGVVLSLRCEDSCYWLLGEDSLFVCTTGGNLRGQYDYTGQYLRGGSLDGDNFASLLLSDRKTGSSCTLVTVDQRGQEMSSLCLSDQVLFLTSRGRYTAVLTPSGLNLYDKDLSVYASPEAAQNIRNLAIFPDGSLMLISSEFAELYLPG